MADVNQQAQELAEVLQRVQDEMRQFGRVTEETQAALKAGSYRRAKELDQASKLTADALGELAGAGLAAGKAMYNGEKGAAAFNSSLDGLTKAATAAGAALTFLMPGGFLVKALIGLGTAAVGASLKLTQAANTMADGLFAANTKLAKSGAAASDGITGVFRDAKKLGLSMKELGVYTDLVAANSSELALFKGTAFEGRKAFANIGAAMKPFRASLEGAGISLEDQTAGLASYLRLQTQIGQSQNMTQQQLAAGAKNYLIEMDGLSKLTGMQREEMEKQMEAARNEQRFRAKLDAMRASGDAKQIAAADRLERANILISKQAPELGQAFRDASSGVLTSDAAVKGLIGTQGQLLQVTEQLTAGNIDEYQSFQQLGRAAGQFGKDMNFTAQLGLLNDFSIDYAQSQRIGIAAQQDVNALAAQIKAEQQKQLGKENDEATNAMAALRAKQRDLNEQLETTVAAQMKTAIAMATAMAKATEPIADGFAKLAPLIEKLTIQLEKLITMVGEKLLPAAVKTVSGVVDVANAEGMAAKVQASGKAGLTETAGSVAGGYFGGKFGIAAGTVLGLLTGPAAPVMVPLLATILGGGGAYAGYKGGEFLGKKADEAVAGGPPQPRAAGGPVFARNPYLVGERGPELMVPEKSGTIINNDKLNSMFAGMGSAGKDMNKTYQAILKSIKDFSVDNEESLSVTVESTENMSKAASATDKSYQAIVKTIDEFNDKNQSMTNSMISAQRDTLMAAETIEKYSEKTARRSRKFSQFFDDYCDKMTKSLDEDLNNLAGGGAGTSGGGAPGGGSGSGSTGGGSTGGGFISRLMSSIAMSGSGTMPGGESAQPLSGSHSAEMSGTGLKMDSAGLGLKNPEQQVQQAGLKVRPYGDVYQGGPLTDTALNTAKAIQSSIEGFGQFTGLNDIYHQQKHPRSQHAQGRGLDFTLSFAPTPEQAQAIKEKIAGLPGVKKVLNEYFKPPFGDMNQYTTGPHFHVDTMAKGGVTDGIAIAGEAGPEAVVPLPDGRSIPVKLNLDNPMAPGGIGMTMGGTNEYTGLNMGPMTTDIRALKDIASKLGAFDKATQTITDPDVWKQILGTGILTNYEMGAATIGTKLVPEIGKEIGDKIKELQAEKGMDLPTALQSIQQEFKSVMLEFAKGLQAQQPDYAQMIDILDDIKNINNNSVDVQKKILQTSY